MIKITFTAVLILLGSAVVSAQFKLSLAERYVNFVYGHPQLTVAELAERIDTNPDGVLIVDVRSAEEFAVSRLPGAVNVEHDSDMKKFMTDYGSRLKGKQLIVYCSVGIRSSKFLDALEALQKKALPQTDSISKAAYAAYADRLNLKGGIFRWYLNGNPVYNDAGKTKRIHPSDDESWKSMLEND